MATLTHPTKINLACIAFVKKRDELIVSLLPRRCTVVSTALILAGLSIPLLMAAHLLPVNFLLGFVGFSLAVTGGALALILCGEI